MNDDLQDIQDAWASLKPWLKDDLSGLATGQSVDDTTHDPGQTTTCSLMGSGWLCTGDASMTLHDLKITALEGIAYSDAGKNPFPVHTYHLPFTYSKIQIEGKYTFSQPCAYYDMGQLITSGPYDDKGSVTQTITDGELHWEVEYSSTEDLSIVSARSDKAPDIDITPDSGGMPEWLTDVLNFLSGDAEVSRMRSSMEDLFTTAEFSKTMVKLLNDKLKQPPRN